LKSRKTHRAADAAEASGSHLDLVVCNRKQQGFTPKGLVSVAQVSQAAWSAPEMVKKEDTNAPVADESAVAKKPARRAPAKAAAKAPTKAPVKRAAKTEPAPATEPTVEVAAVESESPKKPAAKKAPAKRAVKKSSETEAVAAPVMTSPAPMSATSLMFMAPDLPTPVIDAKRGRPVEDKSDDGESHRRTRTRRRAGEEGSVDSVAPNAVVKVRTPREPKEPSNEPTRVKGSTRLEAKKQRRRDGRDAGRRRTVITESEFLARREAVDRTMVVRSKDGKIQIGVLEDGVLVEHYVAKASEASLIGNVYLGKIQNVLPSMEAAFVDIGRGRNAVLYSGEVDWELAETGNQPRRIELALKSGDTVLVQVTKDPVGQKGARLTSQVSLPGRYLVYVPNGSMNGISRKLPDSERARLKKILKEVLPEESFAPQQKVQPKSS
jgi:ribonuclease E